MIETCRMWWTSTSLFSSWWWCCCCCWWCCCCCWWWWWWWCCCCWWWWWCCCWWWGQTKFSKPSAETCFHFPHANFKFPPWAFPAGQQCFRRFLHGHQPACPYLWNRPSPEPLICWNACSYWKNHVKFMSSESITMSLSCGLSRASDSHLRENTNLVDVVTKFAARRTTRSTISHTHAMHICYAPKKTHHQTTQKVIPFYLSFSKDKAYPILFIIPTQISWAHAGKMSFSVICTIVSTSQPLVVFLHPFETYARQIGFIFPKMNKQNIWNQHLEILKGFWSTCTPPSLKPTAKASENRLFDTKGHHLPLIFRSKIGC